MHSGGVHGELTIGEFAQLTHLSVRTLRRYHESGLLEPAAVDPFSGYRYYTSEQIPSAQVIHRLRELDVPLAEVGRILATDDPGVRAEADRRAPRPAAGVTGSDSYRGQLAAATAPSRTG